MHYRKLLYLLLGVCLLNTDAAQGQDAHQRWSLQPVFGGNMMVGDFDVDMNPSFQFGGILRRSVHEQASIDLTVSYALAHDFYYSIMTFAPPTPDPDRRLSVFQMTLGNRLYLARGTFRPYVSYGLGLYRIHHDQPRDPMPINVTDEGSRFGANIGAGVELLRSRNFGILLDARWHAAQDEYRAMSVGLGFNLFVR